MKRGGKFPRRAGFFLAVVLALAPAAGLRAQTTAEVYGKLQKLGADQRRQAAVEGAKKEGALMIYSTIAQPDMQSIVASAEKNIPS